MNLRDLEYIVALDKTRHFGKASALCNVSQPTLSAQVKKLEDYLGIAIFERDNKHVMITAQGRNIVEKAREIVNAADNLKDMARNMQAPEQRPLTLGAFPTLAPFLFPLAVPCLRRVFPKMQIFLTEEKTENLIQQLKDGSIDAALLALPVKEDVLESMPLFTEPFYAALPVTHPLAKLDSIPLQALAHEDLLLLEEGHCLSGQTMEVCAWVGAQKFNTFRATSMETLRQMVGAGLGVTLVPKLAIPAQLQNDIAYRPIDNTPVPERTIGLFWRKTAPFQELYAKIAAEIAMAVKAETDEKTLP